MNRAWYLFLPLCLACTGCGMQAVVSDWMFLQSEKYLDHGIVYRPHADTPPADVHRMASCASVIPDAARDYRGFVGHLHRTVQTWRDPDAPHEHADGLQMIPWFRLMTWANPRAIKGYTAGAFRLQGMQPDTALHFLDEGVAHSPQAFQLHFMRAKSYLDAAKRERGTALEDLTPRARANCALAIKSYRTAAELARAQRPESDEDAARIGWTTYDELDSRAAMRMTVILEHRFGDSQRARADAQRYLTVLGADPILPRLIDDELDALPDIEIDPARHHNPHADRAH